METDLASTFSPAEEKHRTKVRFFTFFIDGKLGFFGFLLLALTVEGVDGSLPLLLRNWAWVQHEASLINLRNSILILFI